jgi:hypothetical protein
MTKVTLYSGAGVSLSPINAEGRSVSKYVRLVADDGKAITNGNVVTACVDVLAESVSEWTDCEMIDTDEATEQDLYNALAELGVSE